MSRNEEEKGTLVLPSAAVLPIRRALVDAVNAQRRATHEWAARAYAYLRSDAGRADRLALSKALRGTNQWQVGDVIQAIVAKANPTARGEDLGDRLHDAARLILPHAPYAGPGKPAAKRKLQAPKKKDLPPLPAQTWQFDDGDCSVSIDPEKRTLSWDVGRNNHAVDHAWQGVLGRTLGAALAKVAWTRGTGGVFRHSDEYAEEAAMDHGHGPVRISRSFGPLGEQAKADQMGMSLDRYRKIMGPAGSRR